MLQKENQEPLAGGLLAGVQQADAVDYPRNGEESQGSRDPAQLAVIRKNALVRRLPDLIEALRQAEAAARKAGLL